MKKRTPKFHLNDCVFYVTHGKIVEARVTGIYQMAEDTIGSDGKKSLNYRASYRLRGHFPREINDWNKDVSVINYAEESRIFYKIEDAQKFLRIRMEKEFITVSNSAYVYMKNLSEIKDCDDDQKEFVKEAKRFCRKLREFNKWKYGVRTPVMGLKGGANFQ